MDEFTSHELVSDYDLTAENERLRSRVAKLEAERDRALRNRDMWKGQSERQAEALHDLRVFASTNAPPSPSDLFPVGTHVEKATGYQWPGVVVASFTTIGGKRRYVVECIAPDVAGALHIYSPSQLKKSWRGGRK